MLVCACFSSINNHCCCNPVRRVETVSQIQVLALLARVKKHFYQRKNKWEVIKHLGDVLTVWVLIQVFFFSSSLLIDLSFRYILTSFYTKYDRVHFVVNTVSLLTVLIPKLPQLHGVRIFGINKYWQSGRGHLLPENPHGVPGAQRAPGLWFGCRSTRICDCLALDAAEPL